MTPNYEVFQDDDGTCYAYDTAAPDVHFPVKFLDDNGDEVENMEDAIGGIISFSDTEHQIFALPGNEAMLGMRDH